MRSQNSWYLGLYAESKDGDKGNMGYQTEDSSSMAEKKVLGNSRKRLIDVRDVKCEERA